MSEFGIYNNRELFKIYMDQCRYSGNPYSVRQVMVSDRSPFLCHSDSIDHDKICNCCKCCCRNSPDIDIDIDFN